jgi:hypothetical protein
MSGTRRPSSEEVEAASTSAEVTYYSVADERFFAGAVALLNSLRLTGNEGELVLLDMGLSGEQRRRVEPHARLEPAPAAARKHPTMLKPAIHELHAGGVAVLIDSDIIVSAPLRDVVAHAAAGKVCVYPDEPQSRGRRFEEWVEIFALRAPLRRRTYVNAGFVAVGGELGERLLARWWEACGRLLARPWRDDAADPAWDLDQAALNALLMSEIGPADIVDLAGMALPPALYRAHIVDRNTVATSLGDQPLQLLHYTGTPKPWEASGWSRSRRDAYTELLPRVLFGDDVTLRLDPSEVPVWLHPSAAGRASLAALNVANRGIRAATRLVPPSVELRLRAFRSRLARS